MGAITDTLLTSSSRPSGQTTRICTRPRLTVKGGENRRYRQRSCSKADGIAGLSWTPRSASTSRTPHPPAPPHAPPRAHLTHGSPTPPPPPHPPRHPHPHP